MHDSYYWFAWECVLFVHDSKALFVPYTEMACRLWFLHDSKALFVPDIVLVFHENEYYFCLIVKHCLCLICTCFSWKWVLFLLDSKPMFMPYTEIVCWLLVVRESKALFVLDSILVCHDNEYCLCVIVYWFGDFWLCVTVKRRLYIMLSTGSVCLLRVIMKHWLCVRGSSGCTFYT